VLWTELVEGIGEEQSSLLRSCMPQYQLLPLLLVLLLCIAIQ
jgi:hypothetical protein